MSRFQLVFLFGVVQSTWSIKTGLSVKKTKGLDDVVECDPDYDCVTNKVFCNAGPPYEEVVRQCCPVETCINVESAGPSSGIMEVSHLDLSSDAAAAPLTATTTAPTATAGTIPTTVAGTVAVTTATTTQWSRCSSEVAKHREVRRQGREKYKKDRWTELEKKRQVREDARKARSGKREGLRTNAEKEIKKTRTKCTEFEAKRKELEQHKREESCRRRRSGKSGHRRRRSSRWMDAIKEQLKFERHRQKIKEYAQQHFSDLQQPREANQSWLDGPKEEHEQEIADVQNELQRAAAQGYSGMRATQ